MTSMAVVLILCFSIILACALYSRQHVENFSDRLMDYYDHISLPPRSYSTMSSGEKEDDNVYKYFVEFNDLFFENAFSKCKTRPDVDEAVSIGTLEKTENVIKWLKDPLKVSIKISLASLIAECLNKELDINDTNLFSAVDVVLIDVKRNKEENTFLIQSKCSVHRLGKAYGAVVRATTYHSLKRTILLDCVLDGFAFEDAIQSDVVPSNLDEQVQGSYENLGEGILKSPEYERQAVCKQLEDMKKFRQIDYQSLSGTNIVCDGESSSTSSPS